MRVRTEAAQRKAEPRDRSKDCAPVGHPEFPDPTVPESGLKPELFLYMLYTPKGSEIFFKQFGLSSWFLQPREA